MINAEPRMKSLSRTRTCSFCFRILSLWKCPWEVGKLNAALIILCSLSVQHRICPGKMPQIKAASLGPKLFTIRLQLKEIRKKEAKQSEKYKCH